MLCQSAVESAGVMHTLDSSDCSHAVCSPSSSRGHARPGLLRHEVHGMHEATSCLPPDWGDKHAKQE